MLAADFAADDAIVLLTSDGTLHRWQAAGVARVASVPEPAGALRVSPDGTQVAVVASDEHLHVFAVADGAPVLTLHLPANGPKKLDPPWLGDSAAARLQNLGAGVGAVLFAIGLQPTSVSLTPIGMPGCDQLRVPLVTDFRLAAGGAADWSLPLPNTPSLANFEFRVQAYALDAGANAAGICVSRGLRFVLGVR